MNVDIEDDLIALYTTEDEPSEGVVAAIKEVSETVHTVKKAEKIVSKKFGTEKNDEH